MLGISALLREMVCLASSVVLRYASYPPRANIRVDEFPHQYRPTSWTLGVSFAQIYWASQQHTCDRETLSGRLEAFTSQIWFAQTTAV